MYQKEFLECLDTDVSDERNEGQLFYNPPRCRGTKFCAPTRKDSLRMRLIKGLQEIKKRPKKDIGRSSASPLQF
jgi:hypothetical protein